MDDSCFSPETLAAYRHRGIEDPALEAHAAGCEACRRAVFILGGAEEAEAFDPSPGVLARLRALDVSRSRGGWRWAAAAALLGAVALGWALRERPSVVTVVKSNPEAVVAGFPEGDLRTPCALIAPGAELLLQAGSAVTVAPGGRRLEARAGSFWLEVAGEPVSVMLPSGLLRLEEGAIAVSLRRQLGAWLLREALAGETPSAEVRVLRGAAVLEAGGKVLQVSAGRKLVLDAGGWRQEALTAAEAMASEAARLEALLAAPGRAMVPDGLRLVGNPGPAWASADAGTVMAPWRWVTLLTGREASTELGFTFALEGTRHAWVPALAAVPSRGREVVELVWDGYWLRGRVDGVLRLSAGRERLEAVLRPAEGSDWGISAWGGRVTVSRSVLQGKGE